MKAIITRYSHLQCILLTFHNPISDGTLEIWKDGQKLREIGRRTVLGELAILYNCQRTATVKGEDYEFHKCDVSLKNRFSPCLMRI